jgi:hypothetical protein
MEIDHINGDGLDNRRENLRICNHQQNSGNQGPRGGSSRFKGVCWHKNHRIWAAFIGIDFKQKHLGHFHTEEEAARAYDVAALEHFGEFAKLNFPILGGQDDES